MNGPFNVGDVVVCVDKNNGFCPVRKVDTGIRTGKIYEVQRVGRVPDDFGRPQVALGLVGFPWGQGFNSVWFRHLPKADEAFTAQIHALRPVKVPA